ncbi:hypothetical protein CW748_10715 [Alteromonadales bacterium alter-6D02]|nr:hypothetical protein CW748_10715 [Alteromonadales bacterium alter-6D02]
MSKSVFDKLDSIYNFFETAKGMFILGVTISFSFAIYSVSNPVGIMAPGIYYFGVIASSSLLFWSATLQTNKKSKLATIALGALFIVWAITNTMLRN